MNQQGWRIVFNEKDNSFLFFTVSRGEFYKYIDIGICMLHFEEAAIQYGVPGY